jgi:PhnB protein
MPKKIDPLNKKSYGAVSAMLTVSDIKAAVNFYQKAFGFATRSVMKGPDRKPIHAELTLRGTTLMLGPENPQMGSRSAKTLGGSPVTLYVTSENVDKVVAKAVKLGGAQNGPIMDMFWGDRCGTVIDLDGNIWMVATHIAEPTPQEMAKKMKEMSSAAAGAAG